MNKCSLQMKSIFNYNYRLLLTLTFLSNIAIDVLEVRTYEFSSNDLYASLLLRDTFFTKVNFELSLFMSYFHERIIVKRHPDNVISCVDLLVLCNSAA